jgi:hypothetical protein
MKSKTNTKTKKSVLYKSVSGSYYWKKILGRFANPFKHIILIIVFIISSIMMSGSGEFSDIAFCIWCLTLIQMSEL